MSVSIITISHENIGSALINAVKTTFGNGPLPLAVQTINVMPNDKPETIIPKLKNLIIELNQGDGVLILTDLFGATPNNIAQEISSEQVHIVCGLNLPMLMRVMNYPKLPLLKLADIALKAGQAGIMKCECHPAA